MPISSLLPNGKQTFLDSNGDPLASGTVEYYVPGTTTFKDTWQDAAQTILNTNPVRLDSAGRALVWGSGWYRQVVKDSLGNVIWDQNVYGLEPATKLIEVEFTGAPVATGVAADRYTDKELEVTGWVMLSTVSGSIQVDVWVADFVAGTPPTVANTIVAAAPPAIVADVSDEDSTLTGWTTTIPAGSQIRFNVDSAATVTRVYLALICNVVSTPE